jgi:hypothetical protein
MKEEILTRLHEMIDKQISNAKNAMDAAQESAMSDDKSSAGDKFETGRAMGHRDRDMYANQLALALSEKEALYKINVKVDHLFVSLGSLVHTTAGIFFISISMGKMVIDDKALYAVSPQAPISSSLIGKQNGENFIVRGQEHKILSIL